MKLPADLALNKLKKLETQIQNMNEQQIKSTKFSRFQVMLVLKGYNIAGHKQKPKQLIEWIKSNQIKQKKNNAIKMLYALMKDWEVKIKIHEKDKDYNTTNWKSKHEYNKETISQFLGNLFLIASNNHLLLQEEKFNEIQIKDFQEYLQRYFCWEQEIIASAPK